MSQLFDPSQPLIGEDGLKNYDDAANRPLPYPNALSDLIDAQDRSSMVTTRVPGKRDLMEEYEHTEESHFNRRVHPFLWEDVPRPKMNRSEDPSHRSHYPFVHPDFAPSAMMNAVRSQDFGELTTSQLRKALDEYHSGMNPDWDSTLVKSLGNADTKEQPAPAAKDPNPEVYGMTEQTLWSNVQSEVDAAYEVARQSRLDFMRSLEQ